MNPGLVYLLRKGPVALWRKVRRKFQGTKGILMLIGVLVMAAMVIGPQFLIFLTTRDEARLAGTADTVRTFGPLALLLLLVLFSSKGGLYFKPAEVQFLFPAPISRRQLLLYNVLSKVRIQILSGLWISIFVLSQVNRWYAALVAPLLLLVFLQLTSQASGLFLSAASERVARPIRRFGLLGLGALLIIGFLVTRSQLPANATFLETVRTLTEFPVVHLLTWVTRPFIEVFVATSASALAMHAAICVGILLVELGLMMVFDIAYTEGAIVQAQKIQRALQRSAGGFSVVGPRRKGLRVPGLPFFRGVGPIAWRQIQEMSRNTRGAIMMGVFMFIWIGIFIVAPMATGGESNLGSGYVPILIILFVTPLMATQLAFDFRRDLDRMSILKSLPLPQMAIAAGQILPTTLLLCFWESIGLCAVAVLSPLIDPELIVALLPVLLPLNWVTLAIDNAVFLWLPYRINPQEPGNVTFMGRMMIVMFIKMMFLGIVGGLSALAGYAVWSGTDSLLAAGVTVTVLMTVAAIPLTYLVARAFVSFDISRDI